MQSITCPLTDDELRQAPEHVRAWYLRVLTLMCDHRAPWELARAAVIDADTQQEQSTEPTQSDQLVTPESE